MTTKRQQDGSRSDVRAGWRPSGGARLALRGALVAMLVVVTARSLVDLVTLYPPYVDAEIPLRAAERWMAGGEPYLASSFAAPPGYDLPFLYPPPVLPLVGLLALLPRGLVWTAWFGACLAAGVYGVRRLGFRWRFVPFVLLWPPFAEAILGGNVQIVIFAAFSAVFWKAGGISRTAPPVGSSGTTWSARDGVLMSLGPALKLSQPHGWVALARVRPTTAIAGVALLAVVAVATLPLAGISAWNGWLAQLSRAADPAWTLAGASLTSGLPAWVALAVLATTTLACLIVPRLRLGAWAGILTVIGAPSLRMFGVQWALPAMLIIRREVALLAATLIATYTLPGLWAGVALVAVAFAAAERYPLFAEPNPSAGASSAEPFESAQGGGGDPVPTNVGQARHVPDPAHEADGPESQ